MSISVADAIASPIGTSLDVDGFIFVHWLPNPDDPDDEKFGDFFLAPTDQDFSDKSNCILLDSPDLYLTMRKHKIKMKAGGRNGGGIWDRCVARGVLAAYELDDFQFALTVLESLEIDYSPMGKTIRIPL